MLKVNGKELTFSRSFLLDAGDEAILTGPEAGGETLRLTTFDYIEGQHSAADARAELVDGVVVMKMPFLTQGSFATTLQAGLRDKSTMEVRIAGQGVGQRFLVHLDIYFSRTANYAQR